MASAAKRNRIRETTSDRVFKIVNTIFLLLILIITFYPLLFVCIASISDPDLVNAGKVFLIPKNIMWDGYAKVFSDSRIMIGYRNTILYTVGGTMLNLAVTLPAAYVLSRKDFVGRGFFTLLFMVTMFFSGGLIPTFLQMKKFHLVNNPLILILLGATSMTNIIICRTFFKTNIPDSLEESAKIDGASNFCIFFRIVLPLSSAIIAVMALFFGIGHWNDYFNAFIYINDPEWTPLQVILREILCKSEFNAEMLLIGANESATLNQELKTAELIKYALIIVSSIPVLLVYPFIQKYFVKGVMIGAIKG